MITNQLNTTTIYNQTFPIRQEPQVLEKNKLTKEI